MFFNLYGTSRPEHQTKGSEIYLFRTIMKVLVYVFFSKRIDFRVNLRNTLETPLVSGLSGSHVTFIQGAELEFVITEGT